jgi:DNA-binding transcriptional regulator LsrR (DeoR family)
MAVRDIDDAKLYRFLDLFLPGGPRRPSPTEVAKTLSQEWRADVKHTDIYPLENEAVRRGMLRVVARPARRWSEDVARRFQQSPESIHVLAARGPSAPSAVTSAAADHVLDLILELVKVKDRVHVGLVGGRTVMAVARRLAQNLRWADPPPSLGVHAVCPGFDALHYQSAPNSFLVYFEDAVPDVKTVGFFAPPLVYAKDYERVKNTLGVVESFRRANEIDVVVTSLSSAADPHGPLKDLHDVGKASLGELEAARVIGDVSYCPYSGDGAILLDSGLRAMTLFQISDLVDLATRKNKHVVLVASSCPAPGCGRLRSDALVPLLANPNLKVWSSIFLDVETAELATSA